MQHLTLLHLFTFSKQTITTFGYTKYEAVKYKTARASAANRNCEKCVQLNCFVQIQSDLFKKL